MKKFLQWLSIFVPIVLAIAGFCYLCYYYGDYVVVGLYSLVCFGFIGLVSAGIASSVYADKELNDEDTYLW